MTARAIKGIALAAQLSEAARAGLLNAKFNGSRWMLQTPATDVSNELRALKLAQEFKYEVHVTVLGMNVRAVVVRSSYHQGAVSE